MNWYLDRWKVDFLGRGEIEKWKDSWSEGKQSKQNLVNNLIGNHYLRKFPGLPIVWGQILWQKGFWNLPRAWAKYCKDIEHFYYSKIWVFSIGVINTTNNRIIWHMMLPIHTSLQNTSLARRSFKDAHSFYHLPFKIYSSRRFSDSNSSSSQNSVLFLCSEFHLGFRKNLKFLSWFADTWSTVS